MSVLAPPQPARTPRTLSRAEREAWTWEVLGSFALCCTHLAEKPNRGGTPVVELVHDAADEFRALAVGALSVPGMELPRLPEQVARDVAHGLEVTTLRYLDRAAVEWLGLSGVGALNTANQEDTREAFDYVLGVIEDVVGGEVRSDIVKHFEERRASR